MSCGCGRAGSSSDISIRQGRSRSTSTARRRLAIEVDGEAHNRGDQPERDVERDAFMVRHGVLTLRIPVIELYRNMEGVIRGIVEAARARLPLHHRPEEADGPPPQAELGED